MKLLSALLIVLPVITVTAFRNLQNVPTSRRVAIRTAAAAPQLKAVPTAVAEPEEQRLAQQPGLGSFVSSRRSFASSCAIAAAATATFSFADSAIASGGATAGGPYLLSAKQRYNARVTSGVKNLLAAVKALEGGSTAEAVAFFADDQVGSWKDCAAAGYLLSNAFRRNSTASPDSLPAVKKFKAFAKEVEGFQKKVEKKGPQVGLELYTTKVEGALEEWLAEIELPPSKDL